MIDLHTHSTVSDGSDPPERIPELAAEAGCSAVALTDHDSLAGIGPARRRADELGITLVPGCEVSCRPVGPGGMHVLVYFVEDDGSPLGEELVRLREDRRRRNLALADRLASSSAFPSPTTWWWPRPGARQASAGPTSPPPWWRSGAADSIDDAFDRYLANGRPGFVPKARLSAAEVARLAAASGGVAVLAHPYSLGLDGPDLARVVARLAAAGFAGIEAVYGRYSPRQRQELGNLARRFDLVATGGSDHHGLAQARPRVGTGQGDLKVPDQVLGQLRGRAGPAGRGPELPPDPRPTHGPAAQFTVTGASSSSSDGSRPRQALGGLGHAQIDQALDHQPSPPADPSTRNPTPASAAREISSLRRVVHTTTRDGASVNSSWWSATPATCSPIPERTASSASATPSPPPDTSWIPDTTGSVGRRPTPCPAIPRPPDRRRTRPGAGARAGRAAGSVPLRWPRRSTAHRDPASEGGLRRPADDAHTGVEQDQRGSVDQGDPGRAGGQPVDQAEHADDRGRVDVDAVALVVEAHVAADDRQIRGPGRPRSCRRRPPTAAT